MKLSSLLIGLVTTRISGDPHIEINRIVVDSRQVKQGDLFVCIPGLTVDGHRFAAEAIANGAVALMTDREMAGLSDPITIVQVRDTRRALAVMADAFYGHPSHRLKLIGVTGTNGKTTTTHMIETILNRYGQKTGLIGTMYMRIGEHQEKTVNTTPESLELQRYLHDMKKHGAEYAVVEVSSQAIDMGRVRGCDFKTAVFTNLTHDHLDYHRTMDRYLHTKALLFAQLGNKFGAPPKTAVLNTDDPAAQYIAEQTSATLVTYGIRHPADVWASDIRTMPDGMTFTANTFRGAFPIRLNIVGWFNIYNALAAIAVCLIEGVPVERIRSGLASFMGVKGRFQPIRSGQDFSVIVDYAHNPDGLEKALRTARELTSGKLICVFGCEGDRDREKRPMMSQIAAQWSDLAILTSDNPRSEDPDRIIDEMARGLGANPFADRCLRITDRREAIRHAIHAAGTQDCVIIAGKGHETVQIVKTDKLPFDDSEVAAEFIRERSRSR
ncbi:UDP-N-acetylmuramoyl-L-alanyl-D-glutamate--2, 6-diaminopimelate ligase [Paenibacillus sp. CECT 9249]|uniref:UDP-N-acetylmuramoyl-L-alanyl-D-glutamate--2, 6-diaminopimelate ligase n=1 Tax=Paenibacillus sp. CECT 9249 TaxID=2845385 RepID=UPI001E29FF91|nr:UDP-N-acetylmuramoyl-L-alanyl-D-glutamate--2,6-diaminopimelate ligase [Paenibacillus sp. CECT 9249]CAH0120126.1 UDP-N-acetylmuramoyl-L-alanyl-D-glutamate--2, 6-diaminopimelate ligase [Paenibacillus sp. CECT 9249]